MEGRTQIIFKIIIKELIVDFRFVALFNGGKIGEMEKEYAG